MQTSVSAEWTILSHIISYCLSHGEVLGFRVLLNSLQPRNMTMFQRSTGRNSDDVRVLLVSLI